MNPSTRRAANLEPILEKVGRVLSDRYGIKVVCKGTRCCTDGRTIFLPSLPDNIPDGLRDAIRGYIDHEVGHLYGRSNFAVGAEFKQRFGPDAFGLLNSLEDLRIEEVMRRAYPGSAVNLHHAYAFAEKAAQEQIAAGRPLPAMKQLAFAVYSRARGGPDLPFVEPAIQALAGLIDQEIWGAVDAPNIKAVAKLAESAWETVESYLRSLPPGKGGEEPPATDPASSGTHETEPGDSSPILPSQSTKTEEAPSISDTSANAPQSNEPTPATPDAKSSKKKGRRSTPSMASPASGPPGDQTGPDTETAPGGVMGDLAGTIADAVAQHAGTTTAYRAWTTEHDLVVVPDAQSYRSHADRMAPLMPHVAGVRQHLLQSLLAEKRARWLPDREEGRHLNPRALHRIAAARCGGAGRPEMARRLFRQRVAVRRLDTAVTLLVDLSHSMANRKLDIARNTALVLCEALARLDIPASVIGFSTKEPNRMARIVSQQTGIPADTLADHYRFAPLIHEVYKRFEEPFRSVSGRFDAMKTHMLTPLGESMLFAARELARRSEPRRILLVLTNGRPTVGMGDDAATFQHAKDSIARIEQAGIEVLLVGILESCVNDLHHRAVVVSALEDLPRTVMRHIRRLLSRQHYQTA